MKYTQKTRIRATLAAALLLGLGQTLAGETGLRVERISSNRVDIRFVHTEVRHGEIRVLGSAARRIHRRGAIPGHAHLVLRDPSGRVLSETDASFMRANRHAQSARFHAMLYVDAPAGSVLTVTHAPG